MIIIVDSDEHSRMNLVTFLRLNSIHAVGSASLDKLAKRVLSAASVLIIDFEQGLSIAEDVRTNNNMAFVILTDDPAKNALSYAA